MKKVIYAVMSFAPVVALAQTANISGISSLVTAIGQIIQKLIPIVFALAVVYFFYGVAKYIRSAGDPKAANEGKSIMIYGVIAIAVMASLYGLIVWLQANLGVPTNTTIPLPTVVIP